MRKVLTVNAKVRRCPCLSGNTYADCCGRFHSGVALPPTAEWLMRSRYSAFFYTDERYLLKTWHPLTRPDFLELDAALTWRRLDIVHCERGGLLDNEGFVEFIAHYREERSDGQQHEISRFQRVDRQWYYRDGVSDTSAGEAVDRH